MVPGVNGANGTTVAPPAATVHADGQDHVTILPQKAEVKIAPAFL